VFFHIENVSLQLNQVQIKVALQLICIKNSYSGLIRAILATLLRSYTY